MIRAKVQHACSSPLGDGFFRRKHSTQGLLSPPGVCDNDDTHVRSGGVGMPSQFNSNVFYFYFSTNRIFLFVTIKSLDFNRVLDWGLRPISSTCLTPSSSSGSAPFARKLHEFSQVDLGFFGILIFLTKASWGR